LHDGRSDALELLLQSLKFLKIKSALV
jgi:hypothetical protein